MFKYGCCLPFLGSYVCYQSDLLPTNCVCRLCYQSNCAKFSLISVRLQLFCRCSNLLPIVKCKIISATNGLHSRMIYSSKSFPANIYIPHMFSADSINSSLHDQIETEIRNAHHALIKFITLLKKKAFCLLGNDKMQTDLPSSPCRFVARSRFV